MFGDTSLIELESVSFLLVHVGQVERQANDVTLCSIIALFVVVINDVSVPILKRSGHVLEVVKVERVGQDVIRVAALESPTFGPFGFIESVLLLHGVELQAEFFRSVLILLHGPISVLLVERDPVVLNIFV